MAVVASNVYFAHERIAKVKLTLTGVNMNVPIGSIYGLLGPSGCGKTTLLKCIIGLLRPKSGNISVFGFKPGDERSGVPGGGIGYMPQELAIQYDLTIEEILTYFGNLNSMESQHLSNEIEFLVKMLELCDKKKLVGLLSGGQKRRVSLAIAMLHKPRLLILDEPTVGVDPILSERIWKLLITLSSTLNTTIVITTHYIDETKRANCVAFMRKGFILEEDNPKALLRKFHSQTLDDVFLKLCVHQMERKLSKDVLPVECQRKYGSQTACVKMPYRRSNVSNFIWFFHILYSIVWKFLVETRRNPFALLIILLMTLTIVFAVKVVIGQTPRNIPVAWVVDDPYNNSYTFEQLMTTTINYKNSVDSATTFTSDLISILKTHKSDAINETTTILSNEGEYQDLYLPEVLKNSINTNIIKLVDYSNLASAMRDAKKTIVRGIVHLKSNFSKNYLDCDLLFAEVDEFVSNDTIDSGSIHVYLDFANLIIGHTIRAVIISSLQTFRKYVGEHFDLNQNLFSPPLIVQPINFEEDRHISSLEDVFSVATFITPGIVAFNSFALCIGLCILSLLTPTECDMSVREYSVGVKPVHMVLGQVIARFIFMIFNAFLNLLAIIYILDVPCRGSLLLIIILMWMQMLLGLNFGALMSSSMTSSYYSLYTAIAITFCFFASNGVIWGIESQPYYLKWLMQYSPLYYSSNTLRALLFYSNASLHIIWPGFALTAFWTVIAFVATVCVLSMKK